MLICARRDFHAEPRFMIVFQRNVGFHFILFFRFHFRSEPCAHRYHSPGFAGGGDLDFECAERGSLLSREEVLAVCDGRARRRA